MGAEQTGWKNSGEGGLSWGGGVMIKQMEMILVGGMDQSGEEEAEVSILAVTNLEEVVVVDQAVEVNFSVGKMKVRVDHPRGTHLAEAMKKAVGAKEGGALMGVGQIEARKIQVKVFCRGEVGATKQMEIKAVGAKDGVVLGAGKTRDGGNQVKVVHLVGGDKDKTSGGGNDDGCKKPCKGGASWGGGSIDKTTGGINVGSNSNKGWTKTSGGGSDNGWKKPSEGGASWGGGSSDKTIGGINIGSNSNKGWDSGGGGAEEKGWSKPGGGG